MNRVEYKTHELMCGVDEIIRDGEGLRVGIDGSAQADGSGERLQQTLQSDIRRRCPPASCGTNPAGGAAPPPAGRRDPQ